MKACPIAYMGVNIIAVVLAVYLTFYSYICNMGSFDSKPDSQFYGMFRLRLCIEMIFRVISCTGFCTGSQITFGVIYSTVFLSSFTHKS